MDAEQIKAVVLAANAKGLDVAIHDGGTATLRYIVDAYEAAIKAGYSDSRKPWRHGLILQLVAAKVANARSQGSR
jgi:predicted amidohydrolase YtcJ